MLILCIIAGYDLIRLVDSITDKGNVDAQGWI